MWIVYSEVPDGDSYNRWYYARYKTQERANKTAHGLNFVFKGKADGYFCVADDSNPIIETIHGMHNVEDFND